MVTVIEKIANIFGKPKIQRLTAKTIDDVYGSAITTTFATATKFNGVILREDGYTKKELQQQYGIQTKTTPSVVIPEADSIELGSRVIDPITNDTFEVVALVDVVIHPKASVRPIISYKEYEIRLIQAQNGGGL